MTRLATIQNVDVEFEATETEIATGNWTLKSLYTALELQKE